jgi:3-oxoacyl-[acyl-carrier-protein] synthase-3
MRPDGLYLAGAAVWLPPATSAAQAVAEGHYDPDEHARSCYESVCVAAAESAPEMAVLAARAALDRAGPDAGEPALVLHASSWYQGLDFWPAASYVHRRAVGGGNRAPAYDLQQMSNGGLAAVELAASYLAADPGRAAALITAADRFALPGFDRWRSDLGIVYGDGAAAAVLSRRGGFARLASVLTVSDTELESMYRGDDPFRPAAGIGGQPVDVRARKRAWMAREGRHVAVDRIQDALVGTVERALAEAGATLDQVAWAAFPNVGLAPLDEQYLAPLGLERSRSTWAFGRRTGHVGGADQLASLVHLVESGQAGPGDRILLVGIGAGFAWTCALVELQDRPAWAATSG